MSLPSGKYPKCIRCNKHLSFFPIYLTENGENSVCGRCYPACKDDENTKLTLNKPFEELASNLVFPCVNKNCPQLLPPKLVPEHEEDCDFTQIECPKKEIDHSCEWKGTVQEIVAHFQNSHVNLNLAIPEIKLDTSLEKTRNVYIITLEKQEQYFLFYVDMIKNQHLATEVVYLGTGNSYIHTLKCEYLGESYIIYRNQKCSSSVNDMEKMIITPWAKLKEKGKLGSSTQDRIQGGGQNPPRKPQILAVGNHGGLGSPRVRAIPSTLPPNYNAEHGLVSTELKLVIIIDLNHGQNGNLNYELLTEIECPVCYEYMVPPIHQCILGHSLCNNCKSKNTTCPCCRNNINTTRNFALEAISEKINHPCKYSSNCQFYSKADKIKGHEKMCQFGPYKCPLSKDDENCPWTGDYQKVLAHVEESHREFYLENYKIDVTLAGDYQTQTLKDAFIAKFSDKVFKLCFKYVDKIFFWCVQYIGPIEEVGEYKFNLEIIDNSDNGWFVSVKGDCTVFEPDFDITQSDVFYTLRQVEKFIAKDMLSFKFEVTKQVH